MTRRITKFGLEVQGRPPRTVVPADLVNTVFPWINRTNWRTEFVDESIWQTSVSRSKTKGAEERESRVSRPVHAFSVLASGLDSDESSRLLSNAYQSALSRSVVPLVSDETALVSYVSGELRCDTSLRRFYQGQQVAVVPANYGLLNDDTQIQIGVIDHLDSGTIFLVTPLTTDPVAGDLVFPLADCETALQQNLNLLTDGVAEWQQEFVELDGSNTLPPFSEADIHYLVPYYQGLPIWEESYNWRDSIRLSVLRDGSAEESGNTVTVSPEGDEPVFLFEGTYEEYDRQAIWKASRFFDSRFGRALAFWCVNPLTFFRVIEIVDTVTIKVAVSTVPTHLDALVKHIAVIRKNGQVSLHQVNTISASGLELTIELESFDALSSLLNVDSITLAHKSRFNHDNMRRIWLSHGICRYSLGIRTLINEEEYVLL